MSAATTNSGDSEMICERVVKGEMIEKYVLGQLSEADQEIFEQHYFECARCFDELQTYRALQERLKQEAKAIQREPATRRAGWSWGWAAVAAGLLLAIGIGYRLERRQPPSASPSVMPVAPASLPQPTVTAPTPTLAELAQVHPPIYTPMTLRGPEDDFAAGIRHAMDHYARGDYNATIPELRAALKLNSQAPDANFFLGICYLLTNRPEDAIKQLQRTVALGESPYLGEAHFYLAKAYLRNNRVAEARKELSTTVRLGGGEKIEAEKLLQLLRER